MAWRYAAVRLATAIPTLWLIVTLAFALIHAAPGGPFDAEQAIPAEIRANLEAAYGLDQPLHRQYLNWLGGVLRGDFGPSFKFRDFTVTELIGAGLPVSLLLGMLALALAVALGVPLGVLAATRAGRWPDRLTLLLAVLVIATPVFVTAPLAALVFGVQLAWLPVAGWQPGRWDDLVLPVVTLALPVAAWIARLTRGSLLQVLQQPFVVAASARGLPRRRRLYRHALRPALTPVASYLGPATAALLTGSLIVETVYGLPGMGRYLVQGAINRDYTLVLGMVVVYAALTLLANWLSDLLLAWLDPRLRDAAT